MISGSYSDDYGVLLAGCFMSGFLRGLIIVLEDANDMFLRSVFGFQRTTWQYIPAERIIY
jgi:hypothetical protein